MTHLCDSLRHMTCRLLTIVVLRRGIFYAGVCTSHAYSHVYLTLAHLLLNICIFIAYIHLTKTRIHVLIHSQCPYRRYYAHMQYIHKHIHIDKHKHIHIHLLHIHCTHAYPYTYTYTYTHTYECRIHRVPLAYSHREELLQM